MAFTANDVKKLREMTGVGMMDCKRALSESDGDIDAAVKYLREKGLAVAAKKAGRIAAEGIAIAIISEDRKKAAIIEVNSETDFVAKNENFQTFVKDLAMLVLEKNPADVDALKTMIYPGSDLTVENMLHEKILTIGENIQIRRFDRFEGGCNVCYVHMAGKISVIADFEVSGIDPAGEGFFAITKDVCMQIAAMNPRYIGRADVPADVLDEEKSILLAQTINEGKPQNIAEKIVLGRINKFYEEACVLEQEFIKDDKIKVGKYMDESAKQLGGAMKLVKFVRYEKGEGIEKRQDNFADEVSGMVNK